MVKKTRCKVIQLQSRLYMVLYSNYPLDVVHYIHQLNSFEKLPSIANTINVQNCEVKCSINALLSKNLTPNDI